MTLAVSVVTATHNRRDLVARCLDSVTAQDHAPKEHVVVDGASTDGTPGLLAAYAERHPHVRWLSEPDNGISEALNKGFARVAGDVIAVIGDDDVYEPGAFATVAEAFADGASIVAGGCLVVNDAGDVLRTLRASFTSRDDLVEWWRSWSGPVTLPAPSTFFRAEVLREVGGFEPGDRFAMDYRHWLRMTERFPVKTIDAVLARHRYDEGTISYSRVREQAREMLRMSKEEWGSPLSLRRHRLAWSHFRHRRLPLAMRDARRWLRRYRSR
jgi:glycosyltransferase involved in cell wall biosynthesis